MSIDDVQQSSRDLLARDPAGAWCLLRDLLQLANEWLAAELAGDVEMEPTVIALGAYYGLVRELASFVRAPVTMEPLGAECSAEARTMFLEREAEAWQLIHDLTQLAHQEFTAISDERQHAMPGFADDRWSDTMAIATEACAEVKRTALLGVARALCLAHVRSRAAGGGT